MRDQSIIFSPFFSLLRDQYNKKVVKITLSCQEDRNGHFFDQIDILVLICCD